MIGEKLGPYEIIESIGSGGMGEVWKARDTRLGRIVAIKKVKEQHSERFKQEARSIAALNHPNICQIHDIGPDYLVLEFVEGKPISGPIPEQEAVRLSIQIASALEEAHQHGIIHRDLKPSNIMVTDKRTVKLLDFGLAKLYEQNASVSSLPTEDMPATQAGAILGTVAYMSPEQAQGKPADARSDIFSFGLVLYEMLSGKRAFSDESPVATALALVKDEPPQIKASPSLEKILRQCLAKQPEERYQTISEVKAALEKAVEKKMTVSSAKPQPSIAVLPFVNISGEKEQEYFSDGLAEEIINALTKIQGLKVIARTSAFSFKGKEQDIRRIAEALSATNVLEGSVRKAGSRIRVAAQLIDAADGTHMWSERYDRDMTDVFAIQDEISQAIAEKLRLQLSGDHPLVRQHTKNIEAYNLYLKGRYHFNKFTAESMAKGKQHFEQAIEIAPDYALAWYGLALYYYALGFLEYMPAKEANAQSSRAVLKALELDEMLAEAHAMVAILRGREFDWKGAEREFRRALELNPDSPDVWSDYDFYYLVPMGRLDEAINLTRKALDLDPLSPFLHWRLGLWYYFAWRWDLAIDQFDSALELDPHYWVAHLFLSETYIQTGMFDEAIQTMEIATQLAGRSPLALASLGRAFAAAGRIKEAHELLVQMQELAHKSYVSSSSLAWICFALGETDKCLDWLEKAIDECENRSIHIHIHPFFDPLRSHPRYKVLLRKMNLEP